MASKALEDLNIHPGIEGRFEKISIYSDSQTEEDHVRGSLSKHSSVAPDKFQHQHAQVGAEKKVTEVEYVESQNLADVEDVQMTLETLLADLDSKNWAKECEALNDIRRLSIFHADVTSNMLGDIVPRVVTSMKNPRSAVCKTAITTSTDLFNAHMDLMIDYIEPLLVQLLLKSSQDKKFVCEAAEAALTAMTTNVSPSRLLPKLQPFLKNRNPRVRAKAFTCFSRSIPRLDFDGMKSCGLEELVETVAALLNDRLPESREAARNSLLSLQAIYRKHHAYELTEADAVESWERFCLSGLSPLSAQMVLRVTREHPPLCE